MYTFLLVVHAIIAAMLVGVILIQRSEGGGLGMGGSPAGLMSARGAADFLTRATTILATLFVLMCITLAAIAAASRGPTEIDTSLAKTQAPAPQVPTGQPPVADPLAPPAAGGNTAAPAPAVQGNQAAPANSSVPLAQ